MKKILLYLLALFFLLSPSIVLTQDKIEELHKYILYPIVRIRVNNSSGSGLIFASVKNGNRFDTYILTNYHVIEGAIQITEEWNSFTKKMEKKEKRATVEVEQFKYLNLSMATGTLLILSDIVEWNKDNDLAILKLRSDEFISSILKLPQKNINDIKIFQTVYVCGAGLGRPPFPTSGQIASITDEIENLPYWMLNAPSVFGNSGGGAFLASTKEFIGIPSRLSITFIGWSPNAVYHMCYIIPISRIYQWLDETGWTFLYNSNAISREQWLKNKK